MVHIRVLGDWTRKLHRLISLKLGDQDVSKSMGGAGASRRRTAHVDWNRALTVFVEGPYGQLQIPLHQYQSIIMISGGIGVFTCFVSMVQSERKLV